MKKERRDVTRSKDAIKNAYLKLRMEGSDTKITVKELTETANISKGTFYAHFIDLDDVQKQVEDDFAQICSDFLAHEDLSDFIENPYPHIYRFAELFLAHQNLIRHLAHNMQKHAFINNVRQIFHDELIKANTIKQNEYSSIILYNCISGCIITACTEMLFEPENERNPEGVAQIVSTFIKSGLMGFGK